MTASGFIQVRVTLEVKAMVRALAAREQLTESALVRQLLEFVLRKSAVEGIPRLDSDEVTRTARFMVRLDPSDRVLLEARADARGMRAATYASVLLRAHLRNLTPLPKEELLALKRAIAELGAIGRSLNEITRSASLKGSSGVPRNDDLRAMLKVAQALRDHVKSLLRANEMSWKQGHAETSH